MIIDTRSKEGIVSSLAHYLDIAENELYQYIDRAADKAQEDSWAFDTDVFRDELLSIFSDLQPEEYIDEIYVYHLTRRLNSSSEDLSSANLKKLLLTKSPISDFLKRHSVTFVERDNHPVVIYNGEELNLTNTSDTNVCYLRSRLGYNTGREDYCFNGFALRDLLMKNLYTRALYYCPEFIDVLSRYLHDDEIKADYFENSTYYCMTYKLKIDDILFDDRDKLEGDEKRDYFLSQLCMRLMRYMDSNPMHMSDDDNPVIRLADNVNVSASLIVNQEVITLE